MRQVRALNEGEPHSGRTARDRHPPLVLGLDVGGTHSRALITNLAGDALGVGEAGGGNPNSHPLDVAVREIARAIRQALTSTDPTRVQAGVLGMAGVSKMADSDVAKRFHQLWNELGLLCPIRIVSDCEVAFSAGTSAPSGNVLIAGTGAIAARIEHHELAATTGGYGWLLGDEGSAFWVGRAAVRHALRVLDGQVLDGCGPGDELFSGVVARLLELAGPGESTGGSSPSAEAPSALRKKLITAVHAESPVRLAELAPLVSSAAHSDNSAAKTIVRDAATVLSETVLDIREPDDPTPIVLAGSLTCPANPIGAAVRAELVARSAGEVRSAGPGAAGAAWLAARESLSEMT